MVMMFMQRTVHWPIQLDWRTSYRIEQDKVREIGWARQQRGLTPMSCLEFGGDTMKDTL